MELNRDQVLKALECCSHYVDLTSCRECPLRDNCDQGVLVTAAHDILYDLIGENDELKIDLAEAEKKIAELEAENAANKVRHGYNKSYAYPSLYECSVCGWSDDDTYTGDTSTYNYCPHCGAKMDEQEGTEE